MMKELYSSNDIKHLRIRMWKFASVCIALAIIIIGVGVATCFLITDDNASMFKIIDIVLGSVCGCVALYLLLNGVIPIRARKNYIEKMLNSPAKIVRGRVTDNGKKKNITVVKYMNISELRIIDEEGKEFLLYFDNDTENCDLEGHIFEFKVVNNKIIGYGNAQ